ncbi:hypothetical protein BH10BAC1_BH10BAC1_21520 [soil metagenome]
MSKGIKNIILFVVLGGGMIAGYFYFFQGSSEEPPLIAQEGTLVPPTNGRGVGIATGDTSRSFSSSPSSDFLPILLSVKNIQLNVGIFADQAFTSLHDSSILLVPDGTEGRPNPFAPIGSDAAITNNPLDFNNVDISPAPDAKNTAPFSLTPVNPVTPLAPNKSTTGSTKNPKTN